MKKIKYILVGIVVLIALTGCNGNNIESSEESSIESSESELESSQETSVESSIKEEKNTPGIYQGLEYTASSDWDITEDGTQQSIVVDDNAAVFSFDRTKEEDGEKIKNYTTEDIIDAARGMIDSLSKQEDTKIISDANIDEVTVAGLEAVYIDVEVNIKGQEGKIILYMVKDDDVIYYIGYNSMLENAQKYLSVFEEFLASIKKV